MNDRRLSHLQVLLHKPSLYHNGGRHGSTVVSTAASQLQGPGFDSRLWSLSVWSLYVLPVPAWVSSGCSSFLPQSKDVRIRCIDYAKLTFSRGLARVNMVDYGNRVWVGLLSVQA